MDTFVRNTLPADILKNDAEYIIMIAVAGVCFIHSSQFICTGANGY